MERTMISFNLPNTLTIGFMALIWYLALMVLAQFVIRRPQAAGAGGF